jgi:hypothetical protein
VLDWRSYRRIAVSFSLHQELGLRDNSSSGEHNGSSIRPYSDLARKSLRAAHYSRSFAQQPKVLAPHRPIAPKVEKPVKWLTPATLRTMVGGPWMIDANFKSSIYLRNVVETDPVTVTPILYLSAGMGSSAATAGLLLLSIQACWWRAGRPRPAGRARHPSLNRDGRLVNIHADIFNGTFHWGVSFPRTGWFFGENATSIA